MATIEQVEKLREKANISYSEAKEALEASGDDILEAMIYLEKKGAVEAPKNDGYYNSKSETQLEKAENYEYKEETHNYDSFTSLVKKFLKWCGRMITKGNENSFEVWRNNKVIIAVPVTVLVLFIIFAFWMVIPLLVIGLFLGCRYLFKGADLEKTGVNKVMDSAANAAENIKKDVKDGQNNR